MNESDDEDLDGVKLNQKNLSITNGSLARRKRWLFLNNLKNYQLYVNDSYDLKLCYTKQASKSQNIAFSFVGSLTSNCNINKTWHISIGQTNRYIYETTNTQLVNE